MKLELEELLDDKRWDEVEGINTYAVFMGYLSMSIKGLGFLVLTWTTVVLLGGFVSMLQQKDFWCLTFVTLVQTAGIFDVDLNKKLGYMKNAIHGLMVSVVWSVVRHQRSNMLVVLARFLLAFVLVFVQLVVLAAILCPLAIIYVFGILISGGISVWRLIEHDYRGNTGGEASNLVPAMDTLYYLALLQCVIFCYRFILRLAAKNLALQVASEYSESEVQVVSNYLRNTKNGCEKDPSFANGKNLITDAVDKICSSSPFDCISGVKILYTTISIAERKLDCEEGREGHYQRQHVVTGQRMLMKHLVMSASSSRHVLQKLLEMLDSVGLHDTETRNQAAKIVERLAFSIRLEEFPGGIQHISSLIGTYEQYSIAEPYHMEHLFDVYEQQWKINVIYPLPSPNSGVGNAYKKLLLQGLCILQKLAADESNCNVMSNTRDLVSKIMAPITSDPIHNTTHHGEWLDVVYGSMEVISQLTGAPGETGAKLCWQISSNEEAISALWRILNCNLCNYENNLQKKANQILTRIYTNTNEMSKSSDFIVLGKNCSISREDFVRALMDKFTDDKHLSFNRGYAGEALSEICFHGGLSDATVVMQSGGDVVEGLIKVLLHEENETCRQAAAKILDLLLTNYTNNDECLHKLKKAVNDVIPAVLGVIMCCGDKIHIGDELQSVQQSIMSANLLSSLLSLSVTIYNTMFISDLAPRLYASSFLNKLHEVVVKTSAFPTAENMLLLKYIGKMVISMMENSDGWFFKQNDLEGLINALSSASRIMLYLDQSMVFCSTSRFATTPSKLDMRTLSSLVKELHVMVQSNIIEYL